MMNRGYAQLSYTARLRFAKPLSRPLTEGERKQGQRCLLNLLKFYNRSVRKGVYRHPVPPELQKLIDTHIR